MNWPFVYSKTLEETFSYGTFQTSEINYISIIYQLYINYISIIYQLYIPMSLFKQVKSIIYDILKKTKHVQLPYSDMYAFKDSVFQVIEKSTSNINVYDESRSHAITTIVLRVQ